MIVAGRLALALALVFSAAGVVFLALGMRWSRRDLLRHGYYAVCAFFLCTAVAGAVLLQAFLAGDLGFAYVADHSDASLPVFYRVAGFWAGQQGSFLLWLLLIALVAVVIALLDVGKLRRLVAGAVMVLCVMGGVFAALMALGGGSSPFVSAAAGVRPAGLNPLLLHPAMVLHPPALFMGYVGLSVPFAFAVSALLLGRADRAWVRLSQRWAVAGWLFLSLGIGLGAWWAYVVLSFGGYWGWDPVENTSLVPWLTATALLHSFALYRSRGLFKRWSLGLAAATFFFTILATWTTRTGLIQSVHAFGRDEVLVWMLTGLLLATVAASAVLVAWRWRRFGSREDFESLVSREFTHHLGNLLFALFAVAVAFGTVVVPLAMGRTVGPAAYDVIARPLGVITVLLMALCPLLAWRRTEGAALRRTLVVPLAAAALSVPLWLALGFQSSAGGFAGLVVCGFAFGAVVQFVLHAARRAAGPGGSLWAGLGRAFTGSRTRTAAYVAHLGVVLVVAGLLGSGVYKAERSAFLSAEAGASVSLEDYTLTFQGMSEEPGAQDSTRVFASFAVTRGGGEVGTLRPHTDVYPASGAAVRAVIHGGWGRDLFVVADEPFDAGSSRIALRVVVFPLIRLVWLGSVLLCAGACVSLWPRRRGLEPAPCDVSRAPAGAAAGQSVTPASGRRP